MSTAVTPRLWWFSHYLIDYLYANPGCELWKRHSVRSLSSSLLVAISDESPGLNTLASVNLLGTGLVVL